MECVESRMKDDDDDVLGLDLQARMRSSLDLDHKHHGNKLGGKIKKMYHFGTFSAQQNGEEKNEKQCCNAYISWKIDSR